MSSCPKRCCVWRNQQKTAGTGTGIEITRAEVQLANDRQQLEWWRKTTWTARACSC